MSSSEASIDDTLIFVKTVAGERAIIERTRLVQRNLRMVLILVERHSSVADLKTKIAGGVIVESALAELEQMGLIERLENESRNDNPGAIAGLLPASPANAGLPASPERLSGEPASPVTAAIMDQAEEASATDTIFEPLEAIEAELKVKQVELIGIAKSPDPARERSASSLPARFKLWRDRKVATREEHEFEQVYREEQPESSTIKPIKKRAGRSFGVGSWVLVLLVLFLAAPLLALVFPYARYLPEAETAVARALHSPVRIEGMHFSLSPFPNLTLQGITVGGGDPYATIAEARLVPDPFSFWSSEPILQFLELEQVRIQSAGIDQVSRWWSGGAAGWRLRRGRIGSLSIKLDGEMIGKLGGDLVFSPEGTLLKAMLGSDIVRVEAVPAAKGFHLNLASASLILPSRPPMQITDIAGEGDLTPQQLRLQDITAQLYDGRLNGKMLIEWSAGASLGGDFEFKRTSVAKLLSALSPESSLEGDVMGKLRLDARAPAVATLADDIRIDGSFAGQRVVINRFGLVDAIISTDRAPMRSGMTRLDRFDGTLQCDRDTCRFGNLTMTSGAMQASGQASISRSSGKLEGALQVELQRSASAIKAPVSLHGSLAFPEVKRR